MDNSLDDLIKAFKEVIKNNGPKAINSGWIRENGHDWIRRQAKRKYNLNWQEFLLKSDNIALHRQDSSLDVLILQYREVRGKFGIKSENSTWMKENGYNWLFQQVATKHKLKWQYFISIYKESYNISDEALEI